MWRPVGSQLFIDVVVKPGHEGEDCDGNSSGDSEDPDRSPDREQCNGINLSDTIEFIERFEINPLFQ